MTARSQLIKALNNAGIQNIVYSTKIVVETLSDDRAAATIRLAKQFGLTAARSAGRVEVK